MNFHKVIQNLDKSKENIVIKVVSGAHSGCKLLLSDREIVYSSDNDNDNDSNSNSNSNSNSDLNLNLDLDWDKLIETIPTDRRSQVVTVNGDKIYYEFLRQSYNVVVCGAGHISMPIIQMCKLLELPVTVIDDRPTFTNNALRAGADKVICDTFENALKGIKGDRGTFFIIVTRGHRYDQMCLEHIINKQNAYIGMIGSKVRIKSVLDYIEEKGIPREKLNEVYTPIGLKIGAETPAEIAVSIMAQIIEVKNKETGSGTYSDELLHVILGSDNSDMPKALVTIVSRKGSAPRDTGTKMIVLGDGSLIGTVGGGCVESNIVQTALNCIESQQCKLVKVDMTGQEAEDDGMVCGGLVELFVEPILEDK